MPLHACAQNGAPLPHRYEFTLPLYSSFTADRTFVPPKLPPRPALVRDVPVKRERRPATGVVATAPSFGNTGPAAARSMAKERPMTMAMVLQIAV